MKKWKFLLLTGEMVGKAYYPIRKKQIENFKISIFARSNHASVENWLKFSKCSQKNKKRKNLIIFIIFKFFRNVQKFHPFRSISNFFSISLYFSIQIHRNLSYLKAMLRAMYFKNKNWDPIVLCFILISYHKMILYARN